MFYLEHIYGKSQKNDDYRALVNRLRFGELNDKIFYKK